MYIILIYFHTQFENVQTCWENLQEGLKDHNLKVKDYARMDQINNMFWKGLNLQPWIPALARWMYFTSLNS